MAVLIISIKGYWIIFDPTAQNRFQPARFAYRLPDYKPWGLEAGTEYFLTIQGVSITYP